jgi:hypothetical protein
MHHYLFESRPLSSAGATISVKPSDRSVQHAIASNPDIKDANR